MSINHQCKRLISLILVLFMVVGMMPVNVHAASDNAVDTAIIFTDLHTNSSDYKESTVKGVMTAFKNAGLPISSVTSGGDAFSVNEDSTKYTGDPTRITGYIQNVLGNVPVHYVWSDHDRYGTGIDQKSKLLYGAGNDGVYGTADDGNYYIYSLSMGDLCTYDRYSAGFNYTLSSNKRTSKGFTATVPEAIANFKSDAAKLNKDRPLLIVSHQPLFDNRNDNGWAEDWCDAINEVASDMDVAFFYGHNHKYDSGSDYYYAKGSTMAVATRKLSNGSDWNYAYQTGSGWQYNNDLASVNKVLNFTHMCAGYLAPSSTGSTSGTTREGTAVAVTIYEDSIRFTTYNSKGIFTGKYAVDKTIPREFAVTEPTETPAPSEPTETPAPSEPTETPAPSEPAETPAPSEPTETPAPSEPTETEPPVTDEPGDEETESKKVYVLVDALVNGGKYLIVNQTLTNGDLSKDWDTDDDGMAVIRDGESISYSYAIPQEGTIIALDGNEHAGGYIEFDDEDAVWTAHASGESWTLENDAYYLTKSNDNGVAASKTALAWNYTVNGDDSRLYNGSDYLYFTYYGGNKGNWRWRTGTESGTSSTRDIFFYQEVEVATPDQGGDEGGDNEEPTNPSEPAPVYQGAGYLKGGTESLGAATSSITSGSYYYLVNTKANKTLTSTVNGSRLTMSGTQDLANVNRWYITHVSGNTYYVQYGGPDGKYLTVGNDSAALTTARTALTLTYNSSYRCWDIGLGNYHLNDYRGEHNYASGYTAGASSDNGSRWAFYPVEIISCYYELDTNGIDYGSENKYLIVSNDQSVALKPNGSNTTTQAVTIKNGIITNASSDLEWYFLRDSSKTGSTTYDTLITQNGTTWLYHTNTNMYVGNGNDAHRGYWKLDNSRNGSYSFGDQDYNIWYLYHNGSKFTVRSNDTSTYVRLFKKVASSSNEQVILNLSSAATQIKLGDTLALNGTVTVGGKSVDLNNCSLSWISSNNSVAAVSNGIVTAVANGSATITVTLSAVNGTALKENIVLTVPVTVQGHDYTSVVTAPTCTEAGYTTYTCACGDSYIADKVAALGHDYKSVTADATCTEDGSITYTCHCGDTYTDVIKATGHNYESVVTAPTCTQEGYTTYTCACGDSYVADEAKALGHNYKSVTMDATCTKDGSITYTCACGDSYVEVLKAIGHDYKSVVTAPTCTEEGYTTFACSNCDHSYVADQVAALGHDYKAEVTAPTCTEAGYTTYTCACGDTYVANEVAALGHNYEFVTVEATCTKDGSVTYTCACGDSYVEVIKALGHDYTSVVTAPTCTEAGYTTYTCATCGHSYEGEKVAALGHDYKSVTVEATCTEDGSITYTCHCDNSYVEVIEAMGHTYESVITAPTCTEVGYTTYTCHCGDSFAENFIDPIGHSYTCVEENGFLIYTCDHCGDAYSESGSWIALSFARLSGEGIQSYAHDAGATVSTILNKLSIQLSNDGTSVFGTVAVTADMVTWNKTFDGTTAGIYTANVSYNGVPLGAITVTVTGGDSYEYPTAEASNTTGDNSNSVKSISYTQVSAINAGNDYVITLYSNDNYYALSHASNSISAVQVSVSNGEITSEITEDLLWTYSDSKMSYVSNGITYYMYSSTNSWWSNWWGNNEAALSVSNSNSSTVSFSNHNLKVGYNYLNYSNNTVSLNSNATTAYVFVEG